MSTDAGEDTLSPQEQDVLYAYLAGSSIGEAARRYGMSVPHATRIVGEHKRDRAVPADVDDQVVAMVLTGRSWESIGRRFGHSAQWALTRYRAATGETRRPPLPHGRHQGKARGWARGCRCSACCRAHTAQNIALKSRQVAAAQRDRITPTQRAEVIRRLQAGQHPSVVAAAVGLTAMSLRNAGDDQWRTDLDAALMAGRDPDMRHGSESGYRTHRCRCPECRAAHHGL